MVPFPCLSQGRQGTPKRPFQLGVLYVAGGLRPMCDSYEARLIEPLDTFTRTGSDESVADIHRVLEYGLN
jgi:hypothetical protein